MTKLSELENNQYTDENTVIETKPSTKPTKLSDLPEEPGLEPVGLLESFITPIKALPAFWGAAQAVKKYGIPAASKVAERVLPKTGLQMFEQATLAGTAGVGGELASRAVPEEYKNLKPTARLVGELGTGGLASALRTVGRGPSPLIPQERLQYSEYLTEKMREGKNILKGPSYAQLKEGPAGTASRVRREAQQGTTNRILNESVGLKPKDLFGQKEFIIAKNNLTGQYDTILSGKTIKFEPKFFDDLSKMLDEESKVAGIGFGQSKVIINLLSKMITKLPQKFRSRIDAISGLTEDQVSNEQAEMALQTVKDILPVLRNQPSIIMDARNYNTIRSILGDFAARTSINRNSRIFRQMQNAFDEAADTSLPPETVSALKIVRRRWEALKTAEEAQLMADQPGIITAGDIGRAIEKRIAEGSIYGSDNPLYKIGQSGLSLTGTGGKSVDLKASGGRTPTSIKTGALLDVLSQIGYPLTLYPKIRLQSPIPSVESYATPTAAAIIGTPDKEKK